MKLCSYQIADANFFFSAALLFSVGGNLLDYIRVDYNKVEFRVLCNFKVLSGKKAYSRLENGWFFL